MRYGPSLLEAILFALSVAIGACFAPPPNAPMLSAAVVDVRPVALDKTLHGDTRFTQHERYLFEYACEAWRTFSKGRIRFAIVWDYSEENFLVLADDLHIVRAAPEWVASLEARETKNGRVGKVCAYQNPDLQELGFVAGSLDRCPELYPVILHELGHLAGIPDVEDLGGVMTHAQFHGPSWKFNARDRDACAKAGVCEAP